MSERALVGVPRGCTGPHTLVRDRLFRRLDDAGSLSVVRAPRGFGKRTLVASWLADGRDRHAMDEGAVRWLDGRTVPDVDALFPAVATPPEVVVIDGVEAPFESRALDLADGLLDRRPATRVVVTVHGGSLPRRPRPTGSTLGPVDLCFTADEVHALGALREWDLTPARSDTLTAALGGIPSLVVAACSGAGADIRVGPDGEPTASVRRVVHDFVAHRVAQLTDDGVALCLAAAAGRAWTPDEARAVLGPSVDVDGFVDLERVGLVLPGCDRGPGWTWPPAVRDALLARARSECRLDVDRTIRALVRVSGDERRYAGALGYAVDVGDWHTVATLVGERWSDLAVQGFEVLVRALRALPTSVLGERPLLAGARALVERAGGYPSAASVPTGIDPVDVRSSGARDDVDSVLYRALLESVRLRRSGDIARSTELTRAVLPLIDTVLDERPGLIDAHLPVLRVQCALTLQLAGEVIDAITVFDRSFREALSAGADVVALDSGGKAALHWALVGDATQAESWLAMAVPHDVDVGYWNDVVRVGGRVARALVALDRGDPTTAGRELDRIGVPDAAEEMWPFVAYARAQHAVATSDARTGLVWLRRIVDGHRIRCRPGSFAHVLITAAEIDLLVALGNCHGARAIARADESGHPVVVVAAARAELVCGSHERALELLGRVDWTGSPWLRAHAEALFVRAGALWAVDVDRAGDTWCQAAAAARTLGNRRAFGAVPEHWVSALADATGVTADRHPVMFPLSHVVLTPRELALLSELHRGTSRTGLAAALFVSPNTIKSQLRGIFRKLDVRSTPEALARARELGLVR